MKVVLLHDWLTGFRGGERILEALCELFPEAPIYTLIHKKGSTSKIIENREIVTSFLDKIPGIHQNYRKFLPLMPLAADTLKIKHDADLVISSSHCVIKGVRKPMGSKHISYIHSPMRYIYDQFDNYFAKSSLPIKIAAHVVRPYLASWDKRSNQNVDVFVANSHFVQERIKRYYDEASEVIFPFVELKEFREIQINRPKKENFFLMVSAFAPNKKVDMAIEAFNRLGPSYKLKIIGSGDTNETSKLLKMANTNVEILGNLDRPQVIENLAQAQALIFPGVEDFGITPLESLAAGTPVIAYKAAGVLDTLTPQTAQFFHSPSSDDLLHAIASFSGDKYQSQDLFNRAELFSRERFIKNFLELIGPSIEHRGKKS